MGSLGIFGMLTVGNEYRVKFRRANKGINVKLGANIMEQGMGAGKKVFPTHRGSMLGSSRKLRKGGGWSEMDYKGLKRQEGRNLNLMH